MPKIIIDLNPEDYMTVLKYGTCAMDSNAIADSIRKGIDIPKITGDLLIISKDILNRQKNKFSWSVQDWYSEVAISNATIRVIPSEVEND